MATLAEDLLHGADAAAEFLGIPRRTVYRMVDANEVPHIRKGNKLFFRKSDLERAFSAPPMEEASKPQRLEQPKQFNDGCVTFAEMLPLMAELFEPEPDRLMPLSARIKNLLRLGAVPNVERRQGSAARYGMPDVGELVVIMELCRIGLPPHKAIEAYHRHRATFACHPGSLLPVRLVSPGRPGSAICVDTPALRAAAQDHLPQFAAKAIEARQGQDPQGLGAQHESAVPQASAQNQSSKDGAHNA